MDQEIVIAIIRGVVRGVLIVLSVNYLMSDKRRYRYNKHDLQLLLAFAAQRDNLKQLGWNQKRPGDFKGVTWTDGVSRRIKEITFSCKVGGALDLSDCAALQHVECQHTRIRGIVLDGCDALTSVNGDKNRLSQLSVRNCPVLFRVSCRDNKIDTLLFDGSERIQSLSVSSNLITEMDVTPLTDLDHISCTDNPLTKLDLSNCHELETLYCDKELRETLDTSATPFLKE